MAIPGEQLGQMMRQVTQAQIDLWWQGTVFTWRWWTLVVFVIGPWLIWFKLVDKKRFIQLVVFLLVSMVLTLTADEVFTCLPLRIYPHNLNPLLYRSFSLDYALIPILFTLIYQRFVAWNSYFWAATVLALLISFVGEPLFTLLGLYLLIKWKYYYGVPVYLVKGLFSKWLVDTIINKAQKARQRCS